MLIANGAQIREADRLMIEEIGYPSLLLMESAGQQAAQIILTDFPESKEFVILAGKGNNGGDGLVVARYLIRAGKRVRILFLYPPEQLRDEAAIQYRILKPLTTHFYLRSEVEDLKEFLQSADVIVDALFGTGLNQQLKEDARTFIEEVRQLVKDHQKVVALDMPSGLLADTGSVINPVIPANLTITFQIPKLCHYITPAATYCGKVKSVDIGIYTQVIDRLGIHAHLMDEKTLYHWYKPRAIDAHKGHFGHVMAVGGSTGMSGAIRLAAMAALALGAGLVTTFIPAAIASDVQAYSPELMTIPYGNENTHHLNPSAAEFLLENVTEKHMLLIGPGMRNVPDTRKFLEILLKNVKIPMILDADALNVLSEEQGLMEYLHDRVILTPHPGEMARLLKVSVEKVQERRLEYALHLASSQNVYVVLKGAGTLVVSPRGNLFVCANGNPGLAKAGMGDVLAGFIAAFLAQGYTPLRSGAMGVFIHALTADELLSHYGESGLMPTQLIRHAPSVLHRIVREKYQIKS